MKLRSILSLSAAAVRRCDTNGDGRITEQEARIYAALPAGSK